MTVWPASVWDSPVLRALDARGRAEIEAAGAMRSLVAGEVLFRAGEPADAFFVVAEGELDVRAVRRGEADASVIRRASRGDLLGEEATLSAGAARAMDAVCTEAGRVAVVPVAVFRRAAGRGGVAGAGEIAARLERTLRRAATADLLRATSFTRELRSSDLELVLDAVEHVQLARGEALFRQGDPSPSVYFIADGMLQLRSEDDERLHVRAYVARGDLVGDEELESGGRRDLSAVALGAAWVMSVPRQVVLDVARRTPGALERARRVARSDRDAQLDMARGANATQHVMKDLYRVAVARSLLVIDQDACVRCGHCAWSCASAHDDGVSRLVRRGDKIVTGEAAAAASLLLPNSCQHCENPACMIDCPTGAIGRDPRGEVFIREDLCIGCGNCAKGCPWDNVQMAPRAAKRSLPLVAMIAKPAAPVAPRSELVAVKCDLCSDVDGGPACVRSCPTEAIARIRPQDALPELVALRGAKAPPVAVLRKATPAWPWALGAAGVALAIARAPLGASRMTSGIAAGALIALLVAYVLAKRMPSRRRSRAKATRDDAPVRSHVRIPYVAHVALGVVAVGVVVAHAGTRIASGVAGAVQLAFLAVSASGALVAIAYRVIPPRLSRLERRGALPEDLSGRGRALDERIFGALTGRSDAVKTIFDRILRPYAHQLFGVAMIVLRGTSLRSEERMLHARIERALGGRQSERLRGLDDLVRLVVERRALGAQRALLGVLRAWLPLHVVAVAIALVVLVVHVVVVAKLR